MGPVPHGKTLPLAASRKEKSLRLSCILLLLWILVSPSSHALGSSTSLALPPENDQPAPLNTSEQALVQPGEVDRLPLPPPLIRETEESGQVPASTPGAFNLDPTIPFRYPEEFLQSRFQESRRLAQEGSLADLQGSLNRLYEAKLDTGFTNMPRFAILVLREGYRSLGTGQIQAARLLGETARNLAPDSHAVYLYLSHLARQDPDQGVLRALYWLLVSWQKRVQDFQWQYRTAGKTFLIFLAGFYCMFLLQGPYLCLRYWRIGIHDLRERLRVSVIGFLPIAGLLALVGFGLFLLVGPFWAVVLVGLGLGGYARRWERILFLLLMVLWASSPWAGRQTARFFSPLPDAVKALEATTSGEWDASAASALERALTQQPESLELLWAASLVAKRQGRYETSETLLRRAIEGHPKEGAIWNNLGNLLAIRGRVPEAKDAYEKAARYSKDLSSPHYNLSQILRREFSFLKGASEFQLARKLDADRTDYFVYIHSLHPNRFFVDEAPRRAGLWLHSLDSGPQIELAASDLCRLAGLRVPLNTVPIWIGLAGLAYLVLILSGRMRGEAFRCASCGKVVCRRCQPILVSGGMCNPCHQVLYLRDQIPKDHRQKQIREMARYRQKQRRIAFLTNFLLPGLGSAISEDRARGTAVFFGFLLALLALAVWPSLFPSGSSGWERPNGLVRPALGCALAVLYLVIQYMNVRRMREREL